MPACKFCNLEDEQTVAENDAFFAVLDRHPAIRGHVLIISKRHVTDIFGLTDPERALLFDMLRDVKRNIEDRYQTDGFNIGTNCGAAAGQTVFHFHLHVIPRYEGDRAGVRGGVRSLLVSPAHRVPAGREEMSFC